MGYTPFIWPWLLVAILLASIAIYVSRYKQAAAVKPFSLMIWLATAWALVYALSITIFNLPLRVLFSNLTFIPVAVSPPVILAFALEYSGQGQWLTRRRALLLLVVPAITILLALASDYQGLFRHDLTLDNSGLFPVLLFQCGPWFWVHFAYSLGLWGIANALILTSYRARTMYWRHRLLILLGVLIPMVLAGLVVFDLGSSLVLDLAPLSLILSSVFCGWAVLRERVLNVAPVARNIVMENMDDLVLVLDTRNRIVDFNRAAGAAIGLEHGSIGSTPDRLAADWAELVQRYPESAAREEVVIGEGETYRVYELTLSPIEDGRNGTVGRLFILHDMTKRKRAEELLRQANEQLRTQLREIQALEEKLREQAVRDPLTGVFNRRYLEETFLRELARASRVREPVSVMMMDIDYFKKLNDTYGHIAGDLMLLALSSMLRMHTREMDVVCRLGGDEFVVILPGAALDVASHRAEELRQLFSEVQVEYGREFLHATISIGLAAFPVDGLDGDVLLRAADGVLYQAKQAGRNRVCTTAHALTP